MDINLNDYVTRNSHNNDIIFKVINIEDDICYLKGINVRLIADSAKTDLVKVEYKESNDDELVERVKKCTNLDREDYFYLPGKILHIDADKDYLSRCLRYYDKLNLMAIGFYINEDELSNKIYNLLEEYNPKILVITGHDAYYNKKGSKEKIENYKNSFNFVKAIKEARKFEKSQEKLIIIAGACQSNYEELIKAGANFSSSPKRINIHALDPAIVASQMSLSNINKDIDIKKILESTKYGSEGIGGIITKGTMYMGYPR